MQSAQIVASSTRPSYWLHLTSLSSLCLCRRRKGETEVSYLVLASHIFFILFTAFPFSTMLISYGLGTTELVVGKSRIDEGES